MPVAERRQETIDQYAPVSIRRVGWITGRIRAWCPTRKGA